jgi:hypothetical protein
MLADTPRSQEESVYCDALRQSKRVAALRGFDFVVREAKDWKF